MLNVVINDVPGQPATAAGAAEGGEVSPTSPSSPMTQAGRVDVTAATREGGHCQMKWPAQVWGLGRN